MQIQKELCNGPSKPQTTKHAASKSFCKWEKKKKHFSNIINSLHLHQAILEFQEHIGHQPLRSSYFPFFFLSHGASVSQASSRGSQAKQTLSGWPVDPALGVRAYRSASKGAIKTKLVQTPGLYSIILYNTETDRKMKVVEFH